jgi:hypothetical protein
MMESDDTVQISAVSMHIHHDVQFELYYATEYLFPISVVGMHIHQDL